MRPNWVIIQWHTRLPCPSRHHRGNRQISGWGAPARRCLTQRGVCIFASGIASRSGWRRWCASRRIRPRAHPQGCDRPPPAQKVSRDNLTGRNHHLLTARITRVKSGRGVSALESFLGAMLLPEGKDGIDQDDRQMINARFLRLPAKRQDRTHSNSAVGAVSGQTLAQNGGLGCASSRFARKGKGSFRLAQ